MRNSKRKITCMILAIMLIVLSFGQLTFAAKKPWPVVRNEGGYPTPFRNDSYGVQVFLYRTGFLVKGDVDGKFGPKSARALQDFQSVPRNGYTLDVDGIAGDRTWSCFLSTMWTYDLTKHEYGIYTHNRCDMYWRTDIDSFAVYDLKTGGRLKIK